MTPAIRISMQNFLIIRQWHIATALEQFTQLSLGRASVDKILTPCEITGLQCKRYAACNKHL